MRAAPPRCLGPRGPLAIQRLVFTLALSPVPSRVATSADGRGDAELDQAFQKFDPEDTGYVDLKLAKDILTIIGSRPLSMAETNALLGDLQADSNGRVSMEAFKALPCWKVPSTKQMQAYEQQSREGGSSKLVTVGDRHGNHNPRRSKAGTALSAPPSPPPSPPGSAGGSRQR